MAEENITSSLEVWPQDNTQTIACDGRITDQIVDDFGVQVKIRQYSDTSYNKYGDATETSTDTYTKAYIHQWKTTDDEVKEGKYRDGEITFVFKVDDDSKLKPGNKIFFDTNWYKMKSVDYQYFAGRKYLINVDVEQTVE